MPYYPAGDNGPQHFPTWRSASYYHCNSGGSSGTTATVGNSTLRLTPWYVPNRVSLTRIGCEFTVAGSDANSVFRLGIYADDGLGVPSGAAVLDAGTISTGTGNAGDVATGGTPGVYEITINTSLNAGLYWVGGAVQGAAGTQPTMRIVTLSTIVAPLPLSTIPGATSALAGFQLGSVTGALPTWSGTTTSGIGVRVFVKTA